MSDQDKNTELAEPSRAAEAQDWDTKTDELKPQHLEASESSKAPASSKGPIKTAKGDNTTTRKTLNRKAAKRSSDPPSRRKSSKNGSVAGDKKGGKRNYRVQQVTCPPPGSDPNSRIQGHDELMRLESRRRSELAMEMQMYQDRWHVAKDILDFGSDSVGRAERLVSGFAKASEAFSSSLRAISEDKFVDAKGGVAATWKAQNRLTNQRDFSDAIDILSPIASALLESHSTMAKQAEAMENTCNQMSRHVLPELQELKSTVQGGAKSLKVQGGAILAEMKQANDDVTTLW
ncbi:MAG: hypothetical protein SGBAC_012527, partial [Bacillariaceae sp.]